MNSDLRFPIGEFLPPARPDGGSRAQAIDTIARAPSALREAVTGLTTEQLDTPYRPGGWTIRQVVHHVPDSHLNAYARLRLALTEDCPTIRPYDEGRWAELPDARSMDIGVSLSLLESLHLRFVILWRSLDPADFARPYIHPDSGRHTVDHLLAMYAWHGRHHTAHITNLRQRMGWTTTP